MPSFALSMEPRRGQHQAVMLVENFVTFQFSSFSRPQQVSNTVFNVLMAELTKPSHRGSALANKFSNGQNNRHPMEASNDGDFHK